MPEPDSERRHVAVLFADLPGLAEETQAGGMESRAERLDEAIVRLRRIVEAAGGTIDKVMGEGVMAVFGAPVAHEDDALRAVRTGMAAAADSALGALGLRAGINAGEVLWGAVAGDRPTAMGDPVNVAARLMQLAAPGEVLVTAAVERATFRDLRFSPRSASVLKGRSGAVEIFIAQGTAEARPEYRRAWDPAATMVGRERELGLLRDLAAAGKGGAVWLEGEAGVGKSRLAYEFRRELRSRGDLRVAVGRASLGPGLALSAFADLVREVAAGVPVRESLVLGLGGKGISDAEAMSELIALAVGEPAPGAAARDMDPAQRDMATLVAWETWFRRLAPAVVFFDDLEQADRATIDLLAALAPRLAGSAVMFVGGARTGAPAPASFERVLLGPLDENSSMALAREILGEQLSPALAAFLFEQSGRIPFPLEQLGRYLRSAALIGGTPLELRGQPDRMPHGLQGLLVARIDGLPPVMKETLKVASTLGRSAWASVLGRLLGRDAAADLEALVEAGVLARHGGSLLTGEPEYSFRQALLRDAAYSLLPRRDRAPLHATASALFESLAASLGTRALVLAASQRENASASHPPGSVESASALARAAELWMLAAERALGESSPEEAAAAAGEAERMGAGSAARLLRARAFTDLGRVDQAVSEATGVLADPGATAEQRTGAHIVSSLGSLRQGRLERARTHADAALAQATGVQRAAAMHALTVALSTLAKWDEALVAAREGRALCAGATSEERVLAMQFVIAVGIILSRRGDTAAGAQAFEEALALARLSGNRSALAAAWNGLGLLDGDRGEFDNARRCFEISLALRRRTGERAGEGATLNNLANLLRREGKNEQALEIYRSALAMAQAGGDRLNTSSTLINIGLLESACDRPEASAEALGRALTMKRAAGDKRGVGVCLTNLGVVTSDLGDLRGAREKIEEAIAIRREIGDERGLAYSLHAMGAIHLHSGEKAAAEAAYRETLAIGRRQGNSEVIGNALSDIASVTPSEEESLAAIEEVERLPEIPANREVKVMAALVSGRRFAKTRPRDVLRRLGERDWSETISAVHWIRAIALQALGDAAAARSELVVAAAQTPRLRPFQRLERLEVEVEARQFCGDAAGAADAAAKALRLAAELGVPLREAEIRRLAR